MSEENRSAPAGRSWRDIRQEVMPRALSPQGRRRRLLAWTKYTALTLVLGLLAWGGYAAIHAWETDRAALANAVRSEPVRDVVLITDGMLTKEWVVEAMALPKNVTLMALDLGQLRLQLTAKGQVRLAVLTRDFPDRLVVNLQERTPVARVQVQDGLGQKKQLLVAKDGVVYEGFNYDKSLLVTLPWLDGVRLARADQGYTPIPGMDAVSNLLITAQLQAPHLYRSWHFVSLARLAEHNEILVKAQDIPEIIFTTKEDFFKQIAQLDYVIDTTRTRPQTTLQSVNLTLGGQVPVRLQQTPDELAKQTPPAAYTPDFTLSTSQPRKGKRDL